MRLRNHVLALALIGAVAVFCLLFYLNSKTEVTSSEIQQEQLAKENEISEKLCRMNFEYNYSMLGLSAPDVPFKTGHLSVLVANNKSKLMYRYKDINCHTCYDTELKNLNVVFNNEYDKAVILCSYRNERDFIVFKKMNFIKFLIFKIDAAAFDWPVENHPSPYYFVLHPDMSVSNVFIPEKSRPELTELYLTGVKRLLSKDQD